MLRHVSAGVPLEVCSSDAEGKWRLELSFLSRGRKGRV
jgi:hypothetical protein